MCFNYNYCEEGHWRDTMVSVREIVALECNLQVSVSQQKEKENALAQYWATSFSLHSELVSVRISSSP